jgi:hypothetical protein
VTLAQALDPAVEHDAVVWIESVTGESFKGATLHEGLKDGVLLCKCVC